MVKLRKIFAIVFSGLVITLIHAFGVVKVTVAQTERNPTLITSEVVAGSVSAKGSKWFLLKAKKGSKIKVTAEIAAPDQGRLDIHFRGIVQSNGSRPVCCQGESRIFFDFGSTTSKTLSTSFTTNVEQFLMEFSFDTQKIIYKLKFEGLDLPNSSSLPPKVKSYLKTNYQDWEITKGCYSDPEIKSKSYVSGDFNGDGIIDYAIAISKGNRSYTIVLLTTKKGFQSYNLKATESESIPLANLEIDKKGNTIGGIGKDGKPRKIRLKNDAIIVAECDAFLEVFYWENGKFSVVEVQ